MRVDTQVLIVGAGPFGLAIAAACRHRGIDHIVVGEPMGFWRRNMPAGMLLRSGVGWHLDAFGADTIEAYLTTKNLVAADVEPLSLAFYLDYVDWFQERKGIHPEAAHLDRLDLETDGSYRASFTDGRSVRARRVVLAIGFAYFRNIPEELARQIPPDRLSHTCDLIDLASLRGKRCLIVGGRQSAFEWAALLAESGAARVDVSYRHDTPAFVASDWTWVDELVERLPDDPGWFRRLSPTAREEINRRFWTEGRLKLEPWLAPRLERDSIHAWPRSRITACRSLASGEIEITFEGAPALAVDHVILATGYRVQVRNVPFLAAGNVLSPLVVEDGFPVLDERLQSSVPGLFVTSMPATRDFGAFFAFTVSARASARIVVESVR